MTAFIDSFRRFCGSRALSLLLLANCLIFVAVWLAVIVGNYLGVQGNFTMEWLCVSSSAAVALRHAWTSLTYMGVHYDFLHLLFNMLWLFWFGRVLLTTLSDRHLLLIYAGGGLLGAVMYVAAHAIWPEISPQGSYLCGASASVLAVMAASAIRTPDMRMYLFLIGEVKLKWVAIVCIAFTFAGVGGGNAGGQAAHVGGVLFGVAYMLALKYGLTHRRKKVDDKGSDGINFDEILGMLSKKIKEAPKIVTRQNVRRDGHAVAKAVQGKLSDTGRLDSLLDKIRMSGYNSLTDSEKKELNALSQRLQNPHPENVSLEPAEPGPSDM